MLEKMKSAIAIDNKISELRELSKQTDDFTAQMMYGDMILALRWTLGECPLDFEC